MYIRLSDNKYPYTKVDLREDYPQTCFPKIITTEILISFGFAEVVELPSPVYDSMTQYIIKHTQPVDNGGIWELGWDIVDLDETVIAENLRNDEFTTSQYDAGLKGLTVEQAETFIDNRMADIIDLETAKQEMEIIFKKMIPYLIR